jgi:phosphoribosyl-ATP pyrophosphohydrolase/phosphoribosyl-AMP cyclohydrolase
MLGYMNEEAFTATQETGQELWQKGATSGNILDLVELLVDCDSDTILVKALPKGPTCHTGAESCFQEAAVSSLDIVDTISRTLVERRKQPSAQSYTSTLFAAGIDRIAQKIGEEATEVVIEAKNSNDERLLEESADLLFHLMVLLTYRGLSIGDVCEVLRCRRVEAP